MTRSRSCLIVSFNCFGLVVVLVLYCFVLCFLVVSCVLRVEGCVVMCLVFSSVLCLSRLASFLVPLLPSHLCTCLLYVHKILSDVCRVVWCIVFLNLLR
jgi:hypothetical protein